MNWGERAVVIGIQVAGGMQRQPNWQAASFMFLHDDTFEPQNNKEYNIESVKILQDLLIKTE